MMAPITRHCSIQTPHFTQRSWVMMWRFLGEPEMQLTGHFFAQRPHPTHFSVISNFSRSLHTPAGQDLSTTWARYSSRKYLMVERIGLGAVCPSPQRAVSLIMLASFSN